jgi:hypothetical protein
MQLPGSVGIIIKPSVANVLSVSNSDSGSTTTTDGQELSGGRPLTQETFANTFEVHGSYNEWRVKGGKITGIFVADPKCILAKRKITLLVGDDEVTEIGFTSITIEQVAIAFPSLPIYAMSGCRIVEIKGDPPRF